LLAAVTSELLPVKVLVQGQPWRWLWIGRVLATALLPLVLVHLWRHGGTGRSVAALLASAWLLVGTGSYQDIPPIGASGLLCLTAYIAWTARRRLSDAAARGLWLLAMGTGVTAGVVLASVVAVAVGNDFSIGRDPFWIQRLNDAIAAPGIVVGVAAGAWLGVVEQRRPGVALLCVIAAVCVLIGAVPETYQRWTDAPYDEAHRNRLAHWRQLIPPQSEVFWPGGAQTVWFVLNRRSYLTISQGAGAVFSERTSRELSRRAQVLAPLVAPGTWFLDPMAKHAAFNDLTPGILRAICVDPALGFVVSPDRVAGATSSAEWPGEALYMYLYDCRSFRSGRIE
jgi:hypothetical protein